MKATCLYILKLMRNKWFFCKVIQGLLSQKIALHIYSMITSFVLHIFVYKQKNYWGKTNSNDSTFHVASFLPKYENVVWNHWYTSFNVSCLCWDSMIAWSKITIWIISLWTHKLKSTLHCDDIWKNYYILIEWDKQAWIVHQILFSLLPHHKNIVSLLNLFKKNIG